MTVFNSESMDISPRSIKNPRHESNARDDIPLPTSSTKTRISVGFHSDLFGLMWVWLCRLDDPVASQRLAGERNKTNVKST